MQAPRDPFVFCHGYCSNAPAVSSEARRVPASSGKSVASPIAGRNETGAVGMDRDTPSHSTRNSTSAYRPNSHILRCLWQQ